MLWEQAEQTTAFTALWRNGQMAAEGMSAEWEECPESYMSGDALDCSVDRQA